MGEYGSVSHVLLGSCIRWDRAEKDGTKKRQQSSIAQEKPLSFMGLNKFWQVY